MNDHSLPSIICSLLNNRHFQLSLWRWFENWSFGSYSTSSSGLLRGWWNSCHEGTCHDVIHPSFLQFLLVGYVCTRTSNLELCAICHMVSIARDTHVWCKFLTISKVSYHQGTSTFSQKIAKLAASVVTITFDQEDQIFSWWGGIFFRI